MCISSHQLLLVLRFLVCSPTNSDSPRSETRHIAIGGFVAQINDLGNASMRRAFISKLVAFSAVQTIIRRSTFRGYVVTQDDFALSSTFRRRSRGRRLKVITLILGQSRVGGQTRTHIFVKLYPNPDPVISRFPLQSSSSSRALLFTHGPSSGPSESSLIPNYASPSPDIRCT